MNITKIYIIVNYQKIIDNYFLFYCIGNIWKKIYNIGSDYFNCISQLNTTLISNFIFRKSLHRYFNRIIKLII